MKPVLKRAASVLDGWAGARKTAIAGWISQIKAGRQLPGAIWAKLPPSIKRQLRAELIEDQGYLCAYCGQAITLAPGATKIEHARLKSAEPEQLFSFSNLLLCCTGGGGTHEQKIREPVLAGETFADFMSRIQTGGRPISEEVVLMLNPGLHDAIRQHLPLPVPSVILLQDQHCDTRRGDTPTPILNPAADPACDLRFAYEASGAMRPASPADSLAQDTIEVLGLDAHELLRRGRKAVYEAAVRRRLDIDLEGLALLEAGALTPDELPDYVRSTLAADLEAAYLRSPDGKFAPFCFVMYTYVHHQLAGV